MRQCDGEYCGKCRLVDVEFLAQRWCKDVPREQRARRQVEQNGTRESTPLPHARDITAALSVTVPGKTATAQSHSDAIVENQAVDL